MQEYYLKTELEGISAKKTANTRLNQHTKLIKCSFCDTTHSLKPFKNHYVCENCIKHLKDFSTT